MIEFIWDKEYCEIVDIFTGNLVGEMWWEDDHLEYDIFSHPLSKREAKVLEQYIIEQENS